MSSDCYIFVTAFKQFVQNLMYIGCSFTTQLVFCVLELQADQILVMIRESNVVFQLFFLYFRLVEKTMLHVIFSLLCSVLKNLVLINLVCFIKNVRGTVERKQKLAIYTYVIYKYMEHFYEIYW